MRRSLIASMLLMPLSALTLTCADASVHPERVRVSPPSGSPSTVFTLSFRVLPWTGRGVNRRYELVTGSAPKGAHGCIASLKVRAPDVPPGARVRVSLDPHSLGGSWCPGAYRGRVDELRGPPCRRGARCHHLTRRILGRFTLQVKLGAQPPGGGSGGPPPPGTTPPPSGTPLPSSTDTTPPTFAGLQSATTCIPGPTRQVQTASYTLTWQAATDDMTPSSQIVYDIFVAYSSGGEDFSKPTYTTSPGATTYKTPDLPLEHTYFVVRARDQAGNEDQNKVERKGVNECL